MPALVFGLNASKTQPGLSKGSQKRKAVFDDDNEDELANTPPPKSNGKNARPLKSLGGFERDDDDENPRRKSPKLSNPPTGKSGGASDKYANLASLRSAKLEDQKAAEVDASVYDYDAAYETFHASKESKSKDTNGGSGPKYMTSLMQSAELRKRDQLRAKEKLLQREREAEGDEFADKEKFVTGAYKAQQEEVKRLEEEEKRREAEEEEKRRKGAGMVGFYGGVLKREEERMKAVEEAARKMEESGASVAGPKEEELDEDKLARELNEKGGKIVVNDEGEVVDKRQLLSAGLNVAPKKPAVGIQGKQGNTAHRPQDYHQSSQARNAREAQRERQSRMVERQIEEMAEKQRQAEIEEAKDREEKIKSKITEADKLGARERYLQRKKEREEEAQKAEEAKPG